MNILLLSDTHGYINDTIRRHCAWADEIWHAGDFGNIEVANELREVKPLKGVYGNIDGRDLRNEFPLDAHFEIENVKVFMTHIGGYPGRYHARVKPLFLQYTPHLFICGHSHILKVMFDKQYNFLVMNPGAAGITGLHKIRTLLRFQLNNGRIEKPEVIELGTRS